MEWVVLAIVGVVVLMMFWLASDPDEAFKRQSLDPEASLAEVVSRSRNPEDVRRGLTLIDNCNWSSLDGIGPPAVDALLLYAQYRALRKPNGTPFRDAMQTLIQSDAPGLSEEMLRNVAQMPDLTETWQEEIPPTHDCGGGCPGIGCCNSSVHSTTYETRQRSVDCSAIRALAEGELTRRSQVATTAIGG